MCDLELNKVRPVSVRLAKDGGCLANDACYGPNDDVCLGIQICCLRIRNVRRGIENFYLRVENLSLDTGNGRFDGENGSLVNDEI